MNICDRFTGVNPFDVRCRRFHEVILIYSRLIDYSERRKNKKQGEEKLEDGCIKVVNSKGEVTIMRPAKNDEHW